MGTLPLLQVRLVPEYPIVVATIGPDNQSQTTKSQGSYQPLVNPFGRGFQLVTPPLDKSQTTLVPTGKVGEIFILTPGGYSERAPDLYR